MTTPHAIEKQYSTRYWPCVFEAIFPNAMVLLNLDALAWNRFPLHTRNPRVCTR